eukprot:365810-Chlamydomonas_euryale.AAC.17
MYTHIPHVRHKAYVLNSSTPRFRDLSFCSFPNEAGMFVMQFVDASSSSSASHPPSSVGSDDNRLRDSNKNCNDRSLPTLGQSTSRRFWRTDNCGSVNHRQLFAISMTAHQNKVLLHRIKLPGNTPSSAFCQLCG